MRLAHMQLLYSLLLSIMLALAAGCSAPRALAPSAPVPEATSGPFHLGSAVTTKAQAVTVGNLLLQNPLFKWIGSPRPVLVEEMTYADAVKAVGVGEPNYDRWPADTMVWLVIFQGQWQLTPLDPNNPSPAPVTYEGCLLSMLAAQDGSMVSLGDAVCPVPQ